MLAFESLLTGPAARGGGVHLQSIEGNVVGAVDADAVLLARDALQGGVDGPELVHVDVDDGQVDVHQQVGDGLVLQVVDLAGQVDVLLLLGSQHVLANFLGQLSLASLQPRLEFLNLFVGQHKLNYGSPWICPGLRSAKNAFIH